MPQNMFKIYDGRTSFWQWEPRKDEPLLSYITRWRNLSIKCENEVSDKDAVSMILQKCQRPLDGPVTKRW